MPLPKLRRWPRSQATGAHQRGQWRDRQRVEYSCPNQAFVADIELCRLAIWKARAYDDTFSVAAVPHGYSSFEQRSALSHAGNAKPHGPDGGFHSTPVVNDFN